MEKAVTPALAAASIESSAVLGERKEMVIAPFFKAAIRAGANGATLAMTSAFTRGSPEVIVAPASM